MNTNSASRFVVNWVYRLVQHLDLIALVLMMLAVCNVGLVMSDTPSIREPLNTLDASWEVDMVYKAGQGIWSGREFSFTYGPLWQWLGSLLPRIAGLSLGSIFKLLYLFNYWASSLSAFLVCRLLLRPCPGWKRAVFLVALVVFWLPPDARLAFALLAFACYVRLIEHLPDDPIALLLRAAACSALVVACFMVSGDCGALSAAGLASVSIAYVFVYRQSRKDLINLCRFYVAVAGCTTVWVLIVNTWVGDPFRFQFWIWTLQIISSYRWLMAEPMSAETFVRVAWTLVISALIIAAAWLTRDDKSESVTMRPLFLLAMALFSCIALQKGVVRSDWGHIRDCLLPAVCMAGLVMIGYRNNKRAYLPNLLVLSAVALTMLFSGPGGLFQLPGSVTRVFWAPPPFPTCPPGTYYIDQACLVQHDFATLAVPSEYVRTHSEPSDSIFVYPYENIFGLLSRRRVSAGVLQNYSIGGPYLMDLQISTLERERPPIGLYCSDDVVSWPVDGVSNFQRTAPVWLYLQSRYATEAEPVIGVAVLRRDDARAGKCGRTPHELWRGPQRFNSGPAEVAVDASKWAAANPDFVRLLIRAHFPFWWSLAKPSIIFARLQRADGTTKSTRIAVKPNELAEVWIYPWDEINLSNYFRRETSRWRTAERFRPAVTGIQISAEPHDVFSAKPDFIEIDAIDGVALAMGAAPSAKSKP